MSAVFDQWYVRVNGSDYGPYTDEMMQRYTVEGRITGESDISADPPAGFYPASRYADYARWSAVQSVAPLSADARPDPSTPSQSHSRLTVTPARVSRHLVMAELRSGQSLDFLRCIQNYRQCTRIGDAVWLVDGAGDTTAFAEALRTTLYPADRMFVVDITHSETAHSGFIDMSEAV